MTYWQLRASGVTQRAAFLKDLYSTFTADADICERYYQVEYGQFSYSPDFHGSTLERKVDRLQDSPDPESGSVRNSVTRGSDCSTAT